MDDHRAYSRYVRRLQSAQECVFQQSRSQTLPLKVEAHGQPCQQHYRYGMPGQSLGNTPRSVRAVDPGNGQTVVPGRYGTGTGNIGLGAVRLLVVPGATL